MLGVMPIGDTQQQHIERTKEMKFIQSSSSCCAVSICVFLFLFVKCLILPLMSYLIKISNHLSLLQLEHVADDPFEDFARAHQAGNASAEADAKIRVNKLKAERNADPITFLKNKPEAKRERNRLMAKLALGPDATALGGIYRSASALSSLATEESCGKLKALKTLLRVWYRETRPRAKVLIFSNSTQMLDIITAFIVKEGYISRRIDGATPNKKRSQIVKEFASNAAIFLLLLSTKAGGVGLNLQCASKGEFSTTVHQKRHTTHTALTHQLMCPCDSFPLIFAYFSIDIRSFLESRQRSPGARSCVSHRQCEGRRDLPFSVRRLHRRAYVSTTSLQTAAHPRNVSSASQTEKIFQRSDEGQIDARGIIRSEKFIRF